MLFILEMEPELKMKKPLFKVMGMEGSANKVGVGIVTSEGDILSNPR